MRATGILNPEFPPSNGDRFALLKRIHDAMQRLVKRGIRRMELKAEPNNEKQTNTHDI